MKGYYKVKQTAAGQWMFNLRAGNHEVILTSETYAAKQGALDGIASVRANGPNASAFTKKVSTAGEPYFVLLAANGQVIGKSEMYNSEASRDKGIASVMRNCVSEKIAEEAPKSAV